MNYYLIRILLLCVFINVNVIAFAQWRIPTNVKHPTDQLNISRPRLSLSKFTNSTPTKGYSVEDVIGRVYGVAGRTVDTEVNDTYKSILELAHRSLIPNVGDNDLDNIVLNSRIFEARALEALVSYIMEENGLSAYKSDFPDRDTSYAHSSALRRLKQAINYKFVVIDGYIDDVKRTDSFSNAARALDLILSLEIAYDYFGDPKTALISSTDLYDKIELKICKAINRAFKVADTWVKGNAGKTQAGNYPLRLYVASANAALGTRYNSSFPEGVPSLSTLYNEALNSAYGRHWGYQAPLAARYWAEGAYYLNFTIGEVLPFWHVVRANGILRAC